MLDESRNNYLCSACCVEHEVGLSFVDVSTGTVFVTTVSADFGGAEILNELGRFTPTEIIANELATKIPGLMEYEKRVETVKIQHFPDDTPAPF